MFRILVCVAALLGSVTAFAAAPPPAPPTPHVTKVARFLDPADVRLLGGPFQSAQERDAKYLLSLSADRLLARFRKESGLDPKADGYPGWEAETISGHTLGHYLSACARMYAATGDERFRDRVGSMVAELAECQAAAGDGYVAAIPNGRKALEEVAAGNIRSKGFDLNGIWVPWYTLHKEMAGLRDCYTLCGNAQALTVMKGIGDFALKTTDKLDAGQLNTMLRCEHGGMNEVAADLFALTGEAKYLDLARRFNDHQVLDPLSAHKDILPGLHSNTQISKVIGAARQHELAGDQRLASAAIFFWDTMTQNHCYATGGNSLNEYLGPPRILGGRLDGNTSETCNTYNMLRLTRVLHSWNPQARYMDFYERALYNHILASQSPDSAAVCYYVPLRPGSRKPFQGLEDSFTCCVGTGMENHASYGDAIYSEGDDAIYVNLFIPSTATFRSLGVTLRQTTSFPDATHTQLEISTDGPRDFTLKIRRPWWIAGLPPVTINNKIARPTLDANGYLEIRGTWRAGDRVLVSLPMELTVEPTPDDPTVVAILAGPIVLAGELGNDPPPPQEIPAIVTQGAAANTWLLRSPGPQLRFHSRGAVLPRDVALVPFFRIADQYYSVYWPRYTPAQWDSQQQRLRELEEARRRLDARTADFVQPGEMQPERDHAFEGDRTNTGEHRGLRWRDAYRGGWFSFAMKTPADGDASLICTYWGSDFGEREFDILVNDVKIATQVLDNHRPGEFFDVTYPIPPELIRGKPQVRVKFQAHERKTAGGVFGCRIVRTLQDASGDK